MTPRRLGCPVFHKILHKDVAIVSAEGLPESDLVGDYLVINFMFLWDLEVLSRTTRGQR
jgi:hypothetical protein